MLWPFSRSATAPSVIPSVSITKPLSAQTLARKVAIGAPCALVIVPLRGASAALAPTSAST